MQPKTDGVPKLGTPESLSCVAALMPALLPQSARLGLDSGKCWREH